MKTTEIKRDVYEIDATDKVLGRMASDIASHLIGKHKPSFERHIDAGDTVTVTNIAKVKITGNKLEQKQYYKHSGYPGGLKTRVMGKIFESNPAEVLKQAVSRMLPKNKHRVERMKRLTIS
ncbi:MAG: 50S ribosomal protein L13 [Candidatus Uhrbacteria bacterium]|nr:50S ribosomal protein L13 [Candidatus Uhrbacteria bacterium]